MHKLFVAILFSALLALAGDLTGNWSGSFDTQGPEGNVKESTAYLQLKQAGETVTGTAGPNAGEQMDISNGKLNGQKLTFEILHGGNTIVFDLIFDGETIRGTARGETHEGEKMSAKLSLKREK